MADEQRRSKEVIQAEAFDAWEKNGEHGLIGNCTGSGKSRIAVMAAQQAYLSAVRAGTAKSFRILLVTFTITAGKVDWPAEFEKWGEGRLLKYVYQTCYASLGKIQKEKYDLVILDEAHHLTSKQYKFFEGNPQPRIMMLTATAPDPEKEWFKLQMLRSLGGIVYTYPLDQGVKDGNVADYRLWIVDMMLDDKKALVPAGTKAKPFLTTELGQYKYLTKMIGTAYQKRNTPWAEALVQKRMHFMNSLQSKKNLAQKILDRIPAEARTLIFASSIAQTIELCAYTYHSGNEDHPSPGDKWLNAFRNKEINRIACVKALNESVNLEDLDYSVIVQANSRARDMIQRIGRSLRFRPGYIANIFIIRVLSTVDEQWIADAIKDLDRSRIRYYSSSNFK